jgi:hypothetical protein
VEANGHFVEFPAPKASVFCFASEPDPQQNPISWPMLAALAENTEQQDGICRRGAVHTAKSAGGQLQGAAKQVLLYCFRFRKCGTFMPLSRARGESRIAVVWTLLVAVSSRFRRFTSGFCSHSQFVLSAVDSK